MLSRLHLIRRIQCHDRFPRTPGLFDAGVHKEPSHPSASRLRMDPEHSNVRLPILETRPLMPARNSILELEGDGSEDPPILEGSKNNGPFRSGGNVGHPSSVVIPARFVGGAELLVGEGCHGSRLLVLVGKWFSYLDTHPSQGTALPCDG